MKLRDLQNEFVELTVHFRGGHTTQVGRVRLITDHIWVGKICVPNDAEVRQDSFDNGTYIYTAE